MPLKLAFPLITSLDFVISVSKVSVRVPAKIPGRVYIISGKQKNRSFTPTHASGHNLEWVITLGHFSTGIKLDKIPTFSTQSKSFKTGLVVDGQTTVIFFFLLISEMKTKKMTNNCARAKCIWSNYTHNPIIWTLFEFILFYGRTRGDISTTENTIYLPFTSIQCLYLHAICQSGGCVKLIRSSSSLLCSGGSKFLCSFSNTVKNSLQEGVCK